jgi:hypothetical protein
MKEKNYYLIRKIHTRKRRIYKNREFDQLKIGLPYIEESGYNL